MSHILSASELANADYHGLPNISKSDLDKIAKTPAHYRWAKDNPQPPTQAMIDGTAVHCAVLEPDRFADEYAREFNPNDYPDALKTVDEIVAAIMKYNAELYEQGVLSLTAIQDIIIEHNNSLPQPIKAGRSLGELRDAINEGMNYDGDITAMGAAELRAIIADYNDKLPMQIDTGGSRAELLSRIQAIRPEIYDQQINLAMPLPIKGTKADLCDVIQWHAPSIQVLDNIRADYLQRNIGKILIAPEKFDQYIAMRDAVRNHAGASFLLQTGEPEVSILGEIDGQPAKCRPDWMIHNRKMMVDVKTTEDASPRGFAKSCANFRYDVQAAWYSDVYSSVTLQSLAAFVFIAVEKKPPYAVACYVATPDFINSGRNRYQRDLELLKTCLARNQWPGYSSEIQPIDLPAWVSNSGQNENIDTFEE